MIKISSLVILLCSISLVSSLKPNPTLLVHGWRGAGQEANDLEVTIALVTNVIASGDNLPLRVEIRNRGAQDLFICRDFYGVRLVFCDLELSFEPSSKEARSLWAVEGGLFDEKESFTSALMKNWILIPPNHFYGTVIELDPGTFPELKKPGRYQIRGRYVSPGLLGSAYYNSLLKHSQEISELPGRSWQGAVETNPLAIRVISRKR